MDTTMVQIIADILSTLTILSCLFLKVPQILQMKQRQSAQGISLQAMLMEIIGFTIVILYNFTNNYGLLTYLEYPIILVQVYVMLYYVLKFNNILWNPAVPLIILVYTAVVFGFASQVLPKEPLSYVLPLCTPLSGFAKVTYIYTMVKNSNADAISITTWIISVATNLSRLFTVFVDSADGKLMFNFIVSSALSAGVLSTAYYYQNIKPSSHRGVASRRRVQRGNVKCVENYGGQDRKRDHED